MFQIVVSSNLTSKLFGSYKTESSTLIFSWPKLLLNISAQPDCTSSHKIASSYLNSNSSNDIKYISDNEIIICTCTKSGCNKKYCECYKAGKKCNDKCRCLNCMNTSNILNNSENNDDGHVDKAMLCEAQQGEFAHLNRNIKAIREALERMDARLQAVEGAPLNPNKRNRGGRN